MEKIIAQQSGWHLYNWPACNCQTVFVFAAHLTWIFHGYLFLCHLKSCSKLMRLVWERWERQSEQIRSDFFFLFCFTWIKGAGGWGLDSRTEKLISKTDRVMNLTLEAEENGHYVGWEQKWTDSALPHAVVCTKRGILSLLRIFQTLLNIIGMLLLLSFPFCMIVCYPSYNRNQALC